VSDKAGRLVPGITEKDCVVKEDGKERRIVSFEAFGSAGAGSAAVEPSATNPAPTGRAVKASTVLIVDDVHLSTEQVGAVRPALKSLLTTVAGHNDLLAL